MQFWFHGSQRAEEPPIATSQSAPQRFSRRNKKKDDEEENEEPPTQEATRSVNVPTIVHGWRRVCRDFSRSFIPQHTVSVSSTSGAKSSVHVTVRTTKNCFHLCVAIVTALHGSRKWNEPCPRAETVSTQGAGTWGESRLAVVPFSSRSDIRRT